MCSPFYYSQSDLAKAYGAGYEAGHHDTVEGQFWGNGDPSVHDNIGWDWSEGATKDGSLKRQLKLT